MRPSRPVPILMYHSIGTTRSDSFRRYSLHPDVFESHLQLLADLGYRTRTVHDLVTHGPGEGPSDGPTVVLTFDDGFLDFASEVLPRLRRYGFTATLYVPTAYVGATSRWLRREGEHERPVLGWDELADIVAAGIECGAHSHTHPQLDLSRQATLDNELRLPRELLQDSLGVAVSTFSYPFGYYSRSVAEGVRRAGYAAACAVRDLPLTDLAERYALPRLTVTDATGPAELAALLDMQPSVRARAESAARALASRTLRRTGVKKRGL